MAYLERVEETENRNDIKFKKESDFKFKQNSEKEDVNFKRNLEIQKSRKIYVGCFYILTVVFGSIYGSYQPQKTLTESSWFDLIDLSHKSNLINQYLVKRGWLWTSLIFIIYANRVIHANKPQQHVKSVFRWILATLYWYSITQRFFGPSIMDRFFVLTGGKCQSDQSDQSELIQVFESYVCKKSGGNWKGGHDLSGHCFLLIHASLLLWEELSAFSYRPENREIAREKGIILYTRIFSFFLFLWWFMLLMTAIYFHDFAEKLTGTMVGVLYWTVYMFVLPNYYYSNYLMPYDTEELEKYST